MIPAFLVNTKIINQAQAYLIVENNK